MVLGHDISKAAMGAFRRGLVGFGRGLHGDFLHDKRGQLTEY
jgi:hypothetical protein